MYNDYFVTSDMSHIGLHAVKKYKKAKFLGAGFFKLNTIWHEPLSTAFRHRRVHSMSLTVRLSVAKELRVLNPITGECN